MSRYSKELEDGSTLAWGHDHALGYFVDIYKEEHGEDVPVMEESSYLSNRSNGEMVEKMIEAGVPETHVQFVMMDLPIPNDLKIDY